MAVNVLLTEPTSNTLQRLAAEDQAMLVWWATEVECASAIARLERDGDALGLGQAADLAERVEEGPSRRSARLGKEARV